MNLKQATLKGLKWTTLSTLFINILQLIQLSILVRLLNPSDFGLMAIVMIFIGVSGLFADLGISNAIIHKKEITKEQLNSLYWLNIIVGFLLFLIIASLSPLIAKFYNQKELIPLLILMSITFLIQAFGKQYAILMQKELEFSKLSLISMLGKLISFFVAVIFAYLGYGVYSLVFAAISQTLGQTIAYIILKFKKYPLSFVFKLGDVKYFITFGLYQMGGQLFNFFNSQLDIILIGKLLGPEALGIYSVTKQLVIKPAQIINPIVTQVMLPVMSKVQDNVSKLKEIYLKMINNLSSINFPIYGFIFLFSTEIINLLFGEKWIEAIPVLQILTIYFAIRSIGNPIGTLVIAKGKPQLEFWWNIGLFFYMPVLIVIGSNYGLIGVSLALVFSQFPLAIVAWHFLVKPLCEASFIEYFSVILKLLIVTLFVGMIVYIITFWIKISILKLGIGLTIGSLGILYSYKVLNYSFIEDIIFFIKKKNT